MKIFKILNIFIKISVMNEEPASSSSDLSEYSSYEGDPWEDADVSFNISPITIKDRANMSDLCLAIKTGKNLKDIPDHLFEGNLNVTDPDGMTGLIRAVISNKIDIVRKLLECRADPNFYGDIQLYPLYYVKDPDIHNLLIDYGANGEIDAYRGYDTW